MELTEHRCKRCGGSLISVENNRWKCQYCGSVYDDESASRNTKSMRELFDEAKQELVNNLRRNLYDAVNSMDKYKFGKKYTVSLLYKIKHFFCQVFLLFFYS